MMEKPERLSDEKIREQTHAPVVLEGHRRLAQAALDDCYKAMLGQFIEWLHEDIRREIHPKYEIVVFRKDARDWQTVLSQLEEA